MKGRRLALLAVAVTLLSSSLAAQSRREGQGLRVLPARPRTPYGLCRFWVNGLAPVRQPAATGCAYAYSNEPRNARVIYGGERGELFRRSEPYYYDRDQRNRDYYPDVRDSRHRRDPYGYDTRYRRHRDDHVRTGDDADQSDWRYRADNEDDDQQRYVGDHEDSQGRGYDWGRQGQRNGRGKNGHGNNGHGNNGHGNDGYGNDGYGTNGYGNNGYGNNGYGNNGHGRWE